MVTIIKNLQDPNPFGFHVSPRALTIEDIDRWSTPGVLLTTEVDGSQYVTGLPEGGE